MNETKTCIFVTTSDDVDFANSFITKIEYTGDIENLVNERNFGTEYCHMALEIPEVKSRSSLTVKIDGETDIPDSLIPIEGMGYPDGTVLGITIYCDDFGHMASVLKNITEQLKDNSDYINDKIIVAAESNRMTVHVAFRKGCAKIPGFQLL